RSTERFRASVTGRSVRASATRSWFEDDGAAAAFPCLDERFRGSRERIAGSDVDVELALRERRGEQAQLVAVRADDDVRDADAPFLGWWRAGDGRQTPAVDQRAQRIGLSATGGV